MYKVLGDDIEIETQVLICSNCGNELYDEELDSQTLLKAYNEYRKKHKLLLSDEIKNIRETYGLSQRSFAKLLNWGEKTI
ncbi:type II TA system antitoxin MqsA family protein [Pseudostreptobacillus sp.]